MDKILNYFHCQITDLETYIADAKKAGLIFYPSTELYLVKRQELVVGFCGFKWHKLTVKLKNIYVLPKYRLQGICREIIRWQINKSKETGIKTIKATCTDSSLHEFIKQGFSVTKEFKKYTSVELKI